MRKKENQLGCAWVIDDNETDLFIAETFLNWSRNYKKIIKISDGKQAIHLLENIKEEKDIPNLILVDLYMDDVSGQDFLKFFNEFPGKLKKSCKVVVLSAYIDFGLGENIDIEFPFVHKIIQKPLGIEKMKSL